MPGIPFSFIGGNEIYYLKNIVPLLYKNNCSGLSNQVLKQTWDFFPYHVMSLFIKELLSQILCIIVSASLAFGQTAVCCQFILYMISN